MPPTPRLLSLNTLAGLFAGLTGAAGVFTLYHLYALESGQLHGTLFLRLTLLLLFIISLGLLMVSKYLSERIRMMAETAEEIVRTGDLSQRIPSHMLQDDLSMLTKLLNGMLEEIERLVGRVRTVSDNIAHDLRHPLTRLRHRLEQLQDTAPTLDAQALQQEISALTADCDRLLSTFNALLRITTVESGARRSQFAELSLSALVRDVVEMYEPVAEAKGLTLSCDCEGVSFFGDRDFLFQTFANLVDNAIKYTPSGKGVSVRLHRKGESIHIEVEDQGPGIPAQYRAQVFDRFFRIDASRNTPGNGLGLSLVKAVIGLHHGHIELREGAQGGLLVRVTF